MTKKLKVRVSALIMCAAMLATSMVVWAADVGKEETVVLDATAKGTAGIAIASWDTYAYAFTSGTSIYNDILVTNINGYGRVCGEGTGHLYASAEGEFDSATSYHKWTSRTHTMTVYA